jgi:hypothetical protein
VRGEGAQGRRRAVQKAWCTGPVRRSPCGCRAPRPRGRKGVRMNVTSGQARSSDVVCASVRVGREYKDAARLASVKLLHSPSFAVVYSAPHAPSRCAGTLCALFAVPRKSGSTQVGARCSGRGTPVRERRAADFPPASRPPPSAISRVPTPDGLRAPGWIYSHVAEYQFLCYVSMPQFPLAGAVARMAECREPGRFACGCTGRGRVPRVRS